jgi:uncharacterized membrane protein
MQPIGAGFDQFCILDPRREQDVITALASEAVMDQHTLLDEALRYRRINAVLGGSISQYGGIDVARAEWEISQVSRRFGPTVRVGITTLSEDTVFSQESINEDGSLVIFTYGNPNGVGQHVWRYLNGTSADYTGIPDPSSVRTRLYGNKACSRDGSIVVGSSDGFGGLVGASNLQAFSWTHAGGFVNLGGATPNIATAVCDDGSVIVGYGGSNAGRWTQTSGWNNLSGSDAQAWDISSNGSVIVGSVGQQAAIWTGSDASTLTLLPTPDGYTTAIAYGITANGKTVLVRASDSGSSRTYLWSQAGGFMNIDTHPDSADFVYGLAISDNGKVVVGGTGAPGSLFAFVWQAETGIVKLAEPACIARAVSGNGRVIAGDGDYGGGDYGAMLWTTISKI